MRKRPVARAAAKPKKQTLDEALDYVRRERANIVYREVKGKKPYAVLVPVDDEETVEAIEDLIDARTADEALAEMKRTGEQPLPYVLSARSWASSSVAARGGASTPASSP